jgi:hypothetical protein
MPGLIVGDVEQSLISPESGDEDSSIQRLGMKLWSKQLGIWRCIASHRTTLILRHQEQSYATIDASSTSYYASSPAHNYWPPLDGPTQIPYIGGRRPWDLFKTTGFLKVAG